MEHVQARERQGAALVASIVESGAVAGLVGGIGMIAWLAIFGLFVDGVGLLGVPKLIGATFYGRAALGPGFGAAWWGLVLHMAVSIGFGVLFAAVAKRELDPMVEVAGAIVYGLFLWLVLTFVVMPAVDPVMREWIPRLSSGWFGAHVVYGACLGLVPQLRRALRPASA